MIWKKKTGIVKGEIKRTDTGIWRWVPNNFLSFSITNNVMVLIRMENLQKLLQNSLQILPYLFLCWQEGNQAQWYKQHLLCISESLPRSYIPYSNTSLTYKEREQLVLSMQFLPQSRKRWSGDELSRDKQKRLYTYANSIGSVPSPRLNRGFVFGTYLNQSQSYLPTRS